MPNKNTDPAVTKCRNKHIHSSQFVQMELCGTTSTHGNAQGSYKQRHPPTWQGDSQGMGVMSPLRQTQPPPMWYGLAQESAALQ